MVEYNLNQNLYKQKRLNITLYDGIKFSVCKKLIAKTKQINQLTIPQDRIPKKKNIHEVVKNTHEVPISPTTCL